MPTALSSSDGAVLLSFVKLVASDFGWSDSCLVVDVASVEVKDEEAVVVVVEEVVEVVVVVVVVGVVQV